MEEFGKGVQIVERVAPSYDNKLSCCSEESSARQSNKNDLVEDRVLNKFCGLTVVYGDFVLCGRNFQISLVSRYNTDKQSAKNYLTRAGC